MPITVHLVRDLPGGVLYALSPDGNRLPAPARDLIKSMFGAGYADQHDNGPRCAAWKMPAEAADSVVRQLELAGYACITSEFEDLAIGPRLGECPDCHGARLLASAVCSWCSTTVPAALPADLQPKRSECGPPPPGWRMRRSDATS